MQRGKCKLCLEEKELQESHLLPAAVYRMCRPESGEITDPVGIRNDLKTKTICVFQPKDNNASNPVGMRVIGFCRANSCSANGRRPSYSCQRSGSNEKPKPCRAHQSV